MAWFYDLLVNRLINHLPLKYYYMLTPNNELKYSATGTEAETEFLRKSSSLTSAFSVDDDLEDDDEDDDDDLVIDEVDADDVEIDDVDIDVDDADVAADDLDEDVELDDDDDDEDDDLV